MSIGKVSKTQYNDLKNSYLEKNRTLHSLYMQANKENSIDKQLFFKLINKIRQEEGLNEYYTKREKKLNNIVEKSDKSPNYYN
ncbi:hypothetical protein [Methanobrevibacter sp.]|uniref:hypothetical protein n=1 Tax=Methanobrevibacter sp. TaxID=66852 RepID=UPI0026E0BAEA|nr:hypothetical protein [Methanobrevibacter sp.]MDO5824606.1 hypothetical protein [Methanobrevibacter sp.]